MPRSIAAGRTACGLERKELLMMKKTIGLLAALTLTLTSAGVMLPASAENENVWAEETAGTDEISDEEARAEIEQYALDHYDPQYGKYLKSLEAAEEISQARRNGSEALMGAQGGSEADKYTGYTYTHQSRFDDCDKVYGVDVSFFQYQIDWNKVKADGIDFAIIRLGYRGYGSGGELMLDTRFKENIKNAKAAGLEVGIYFYTQAITTAEAVEEAEYCINNLKGYTLDLPVYFDMETVDWDVGRLDSANLSVAQKTAICKAFCNRIKKAGYDAGIYSNPNWLYYYLNAAELEKLYPIWLANYTSYTYYDGEFSTWQYAYTGEVDGIPTNVDMNVDYRAPGSAKNIVPDTPENLSATLSGSSAVIEWSPVTKADKYEVYRYYPATGRYSKVSTVTDPRVSVYAGSSVVPYTVRAVRISGGNTYYSEYSDIVYISNKLISGLAASADPSKITLSWDGIDSARGYTVYRSANGGKYTKVASVAGTAYTDTKVSAATKYSYRVAPVFGEDDALAEGAASSPVSAVLAPRKISVFSVSTQTKNSVTVKFGHLANATGYQFAVYDPETKTYTISGTSDNSALSYKFTSLEPGTAYQFCVRAFSTAGGVTSYGEWSNPVKTATVISAPTGTKATITPSKVTLNWTASKGAEGYYVYRRTSSTYVKVASTVSNSVSFTDGTAGSRSYAVAAYFTADGMTYSSTYSTPCTIDGTIPATPTITSSSGSYGTAVLKWTAVPNVTGYRVYKYNSATGAYETAKTINAKNTSCSISGINTNTAKFKIKAFRREEGGTVWGNASAIKTVKFSLSAPDYLYTTLTPNSVTAKWNAVDSADSYTLYKSTDAGYTEVGTTADCSLTFNDFSEGVKAYVVTANINDADGVIASDYSYESRLASIPDSPRFISQSGTTNQVKLYWDRDYAADGYRVYLYNKNTGEYEKVKTIQSGAKTVCTITGLDAGTTYRFKIKTFTRGVSGISWSKASDAYYVTTASGYSLE